LKAGVQMPCILGHEIAGVVVEVGAKVSRFKAGDRVATVQRYHICGACHFCRGAHEPLCGERRFLGDWGLFGGYAEYVAVEDDNVALVPDGVALEAASIAACTVGTVFNAVRDVGKLQLGESVLVTGAGGGLGLHALQVANAAGAYVIAQTSSEDKASTMRKMGAHEVIVHARGEDFSPQVKALTAGRGVDVLIDNVGTPLFAPMRKSLAVGGRWLMIGQVNGDFVPFNPAQLFLKNQSMLSVTSTTRSQLEDVLQLVARGKVTPVISQTFALDHAQRAHTLVEGGTMMGRAVIRPDWSAA
jgi:D-arabinose 1-dehydrogenase-like Zn-dependent alcohol dehydrogenase